MLGLGVVRFCRSHARSPLREDQETLRCLIRELQRTEQTRSGSRANGSSISGEGVRPIVTDQNDSIGWDRRAAVLAIAIAVVLAALLQLIVFEQYSSERLATLAVVVVLFAILIFVYAGGYGWIRTSWSERQARRFIRHHPEMITALEGLILQIESTIADRGDHFAPVALALLNEWSRVSNVAPPHGGAPTFTPNERAFFENAHRASGAWGTHLGDWHPLRTGARQILQTTARSNSLAYLTVSYLIRSYIASSLVYIRDFTLNMQQAGAAKLGQIPLAEWSTFARTVNDLLKTAREIDQFGPSKVGYGLDLKFEPVVENLALAAPVNSTGAAVKVVAGSPTSGSSP
jgi:hypothetical protein